MILIGLGNKARQGKDIACEALVSHFFEDFDIRQYRFAQALYEECRTLHGMKEKDAPLLQRIGDERRQENPEYWIDKVFAQIESDKPDIAVISDVRYWNEADKIRSEGGYLIHVSRLNEDGTAFVASDRPAGFISEIQLDGYNWDFHITSKSPELTEELAVTIVGYILDKCKED